MFYTKEGGGLFSDHQRWEVNLHLQIIKSNSSKAFSKNSLAQWAIFILLSSNMVTYIRGMNPSIFHMPYIVLFDLFFRRVYHVTNFFLFFFNIILGLFSCLKRILFSVVFGTLLISRLDRCLLMRGFETFDAGNKSL